MKYVLAFLPPDRLHHVIDVLADHHVRGLSVSDARGFGQEHDPAHPEYRETPGVEMTKKARVEIVCADGDVGEVLAAFYAAAHTGRAGDGKVFVLDVVDALRLKTGERGEAAIGPASGEAPR
jgi:nitrogen regulatory protein P-II 1